MKLKTEKTPGEVFDYAMSFTKELQTGETIDSVTVSSTQRYSWRDTTARIIGSEEGYAPEEIGNFAVFWLKGGKAGEVHDVKAQVTTSGGRTLDGFLELRIVRKKR